MIHPTAHVAPGAVVADGVEIGPFTIVHGNATIGPGSRIDGYCEIGYPVKSLGDARLVIGGNSVIRSHSVFYQGSTFGAGLMTGHHVLVREKTVAGRGLQVGSYGDIEGDCRIGHYTRMQSLVHISQKSVIGNFCWIFPGALLSNDALPPSDGLDGVTLGDYVVVAIKATVLPGKKIGKGSFIAAHALVGQDMPEDSLVAGSPARRVARASDMRSPHGKRESAYPWTKRFVRGYPPEVVEGWARGIDTFEFD